MIGQCKCGSRAINDDPDRLLCDRCWRDAEIERLRGELDECRRLLREAERQQDVHDLFVRVLDTISGRAFLRNEENRAFQMMGRYDGAMSEACKALFARQKADVEAVQVILQAARAAGGEG